MTESNSTCTHCGCVCDDLTTVVDDGRLMHAENACELALRSFAPTDLNDGDIAWIDGLPVALTDAVARATQLMQEARRPLIHGCVNATVEAQSAAVKLAQQLGGVFDSPALPDPTLFPAIGTITCSLGEAKNRADMIVLWNCDPNATHPRLLSRYLLEPFGRFCPDGRRGRSLVVVGANPGQIDADDVVTLNDDGFAALWMMRARTRDRCVDGPASPLESLVDRLRAVRFGVIVIDESAGSRVIEAAHGLATDLQAHTRCYVLVLRGAGNGGGVRQVVTWLTGQAAPVSFAEDGVIRHGPEFRAHSVIDRGEVDALLSIGLPPAGVDLRKLPQIHLTPRITPAAQSAAVAIRTAAFPLAQTGTVLRLDSVALPIRAVLPSSAPSEIAVLNQIARSLRPANR